VARTSRTNNPTAAAFLKRFELKIFTPP